MKSVHSLVLAASLAAGAHALDDGSGPFYRASTGHANADGNSTANLVLLSEYVGSTGARCLDGSPGAYYVRKGVGDGANKWYIHHQGGGWCETYEDCHNRSFTGLGTSTGYPKSMSLINGYMDPTPAVNPMMYNWNIAYVQYCDGGSYSGNNDTTATVQGRQLFFRGKRIREAVYDSLSKIHGLGEATDVVISGCSAGGLAAYLHVDLWCDALKRDAPGVKCVGMPDSGFFLDYQDPRRHGLLGNTQSGNYHAGLKWVFKTMNASGAVNRDCVSAKSSGGAAADEDAYLCMFAEHTSPFTHTPVFALQSDHDSWQTSHVLYYPNDAADVNVMGRNLTSRMHSNLLGPQCAHTRSHARMIT